MPNPADASFLPAHPTDGVGGVVIGGDFQGLGIVRSLGHHGIPTCVIDDEFSISRFSRFATHSVRVPDLRDEENVIKALLQVGQRLNLRGWVLYPTRDETVAALASHKDELVKWFRVPTPTLATVKWAWDKRNTYALAQSLNIPCPKTWFPRTVEDVKRIDATFPLILKPAIKENFVYEARAKAWRIDNKEHLIQRFLEASAFVPEGEMMVQDLIPGGSAEQQYGCGLFFSERRPVATMVAHYVRAHPPDFGRCSTFVQTVDLPELENLSIRFLEAIDYYGLAELEYRRDPRDGVFKLLDVNARTWGYHSLGKAAGVDFAYLLFQHQMGRSVNPLRAHPNVRWLRWVTDLPVGMHGLFLRKWNIFKYLKSISGTHVEAVFDIADPLPSLIETALIPYLALTRGY